MIDATKYLRRLLFAWAALGRDQVGQATLEYASISTVLLLGGLAIASTTYTPIVPAFFKALQGYVDLMFYALNLSVG